MRKISLFCLLSFVLLSLNGFSQLKLVGKLPYWIEDKSQILRFKSNHIVAISCPNFHLKDPNDRMFLSSKISLFNTKDSLSFGFMKENILAKKGDGFFSHRFPSQNLSNYFMNYNGENRYAFVFYGKYAYVNFKTGKVYKGNNSTVTISSKIKSLDFEKNYSFLAFYCSENYFGLVLKKQPYYNQQLAYLGISSDGMSNKKLLKKDNNFDAIKTEMTNDTVKSSRDLLVKHQANTVTRIINGEKISEYEITLMFYDSKTSQKLGEYKFKPEYKIDRSKRTPLTEIEMSEDNKYLIFFVKKGYQTSGETHVYELPKIEIK